MFVASLRSQRCTAMVSRVVHLVGSRDRHVDSECSLRVGGHSGSVFNLAVEAAGCIERVQVGMEQCVCELGDEVGSVEQGPSVAVLFIHSIVYVFDE